MTLIVRVLFISWILIGAGSLLAGPAQAHPEDEFCTADFGVDPALCRALQDLDRQDGSPASASELADRSAFETFRLYIQIGVQHILPGGLDHILFVLALCFAAQSLRQQLLQVSVFTLAHTATLGLVAAGVFAPPASIVEPLIALTIAGLAIEVMFFPRFTRWRLLVIFAFGLIHGMGFAGFFGTLGLPEGQFWSALIGFNIGVEIGQLTIIAAALLALWPLQQSLTARAAQVWIRIPVCSVIAVIGLTWTVQRIFG